MAASPKKESEAISNSPNAEPITNTKAFMPKALIDRAAAIHMAVENLCAMDPHKMRALPFTTRQTTSAKSRTGESSGRVASRIGWTCASKK